MGGGTGAAPLAFVRTLPQGRDFEGQVTLGLEVRATLGLPFVVMGACSGRNVSPAGVGDGLLGWEGRSWRTFCDPVAVTEACRGQKAPSLREAGRCWLRSPWGTWVLFSRDGCPSASGLLVFQENPETQVCM